MERCLLSYSCVTLVAITTTIKGYRSDHSTETALLKVFSDVLTAIDDKKVTLLALLDLNAAFDCVDHDILLSRLQSRFGLDGAVLTWIRSFLSDRTQRVCFGGRLSAEIALIFGVLQGSVLGPLLFLLYAAKLFDIITSPGLTGHSYGMVHKYISVLQWSRVSKPQHVWSNVSSNLIAGWGRMVWSWTPRRPNRSRLGSRHQLAKLTVSQLPLATTTSSSTVDIVSTANEPVRVRGDHDKNYDCSGNRNKVLALAEVP